MFEKIECPWCHAEIFAPVDDRKGFVECINDIKTGYRHTVCPECQKSIILLDDVNVDLMSSTVVRFDTEDDKVKQMFIEFESKHHDEIVAMKKELDEALGIIRDAWDNPEPEEKKIKLVLVSPNNDVLETAEDVKDYIRDNYDYCDLEDWVNDNFDEFEVGPFAWGPVEIIEGMGASMGDIACEQSYNCNYAEDRYDNSDIVSDFEEIDDPNNIDTPDDGEVIMIAGIRFTYKYVEAEKDDSKV